MHGRIIEEMIELGLVIGRCQRKSVHRRVCVPHEFFTRPPTARPMDFYSCDTMLERVLAMALCPSLCVCLSASSRSFIETDGRIELVFGMGAFFCHPTLC